VLGHYGPGHVSDQQRVMPCVQVADSGAGSQAAPRFLHERALARMRTPATNVRSAPRKSQFSTLYIRTLRLLGNAGFENAHEHTKHESQASNRP